MYSAEKAGENVIGIAFMASCAGLGSLRFLPIEEPQNSTSVKLNNANPTKIWTDNNGNLFVISPEDSKIKVFDLQGCLIYENVVEQNSTFNVNLNNGAYIVSMTNNSQTVNKRIIIR